MKKVFTILLLCTATVAFCFIFMNCTKQKIDIQTELSTSANKNLSISPPTSVEVQLSSVACAKNGLKNFVKSRELMVTNAISVSEAEIQAFGFLKQMDSRLNSFKVYFGQKNVTKPNYVMTRTDRVYALGVIADTDQVNVIYSVSAIGTDLCPILCDLTSPLLQQQKKKDVSNPPIMDDNIQQITLEQAQFFIQGYQITASPLIPYAFTFNSWELLAMELIKRAYPATTHYRIYLASECFIVVGVDLKTNKDNVKMIYKVAANGSGLCPNLCDESSPIMRIED